MSRQSRYRPRDDADTIRLVSENPLAWIFVTDSDGPFATAAMVRPVVTENRISTLVGHVGRGRRIAWSLAKSCEGLLLFLGPHGYISPSWMHDRTQAPTWNFTSAQFVVAMKAVDDAEYLECHLRDLTSAMEQDRNNAWSVDEMGARLRKLATRIVAFEASIIDTRHRFKLGQDEGDETYREIVQALEAEGRQDLIDWMNLYNAGRN